ncbi:LIC_13346 family putative lipoprotein [Leptospira stimsonii]|uniref:Lipoprotein n=1 Tax=Leptospira stimsonii TaxID=2202203 RepID=A0A4R9L9D3_9LEPT|nr:hypothetical protein [Leptospira stimsonii]RHX87904.1 hypothetical protein DLM78_02710 [Leptospira stimsonii]TGK11259.1 hypothetical protein EHO98_22250 [Leptospira stimsonii]TGM19245.1 hypothetical protein EHQ90_04915 [Leptospira stimsonii]
MKKVFRLSKPVSNRFPFPNLVLILLWISLFFFHCGSFAWHLFENTKNLSEQYSSQIYFVSNPIVSPYYENSSFQSRYIFLRNQSGKEEMVQGILKYMELSGKAEQSERVLLDVFEWRGNFQRNPNDKHKLEFTPKYVSKRIEKSNSKSIPEILHPSAKVEPLENLKKEFLIGDDGGIRETEETRIVPGIGTLKWKHSLRGILVRIMQTEFISANGTLTSSRDYDYDSLEYPPAIGLTGTIPVVPLKKEESYVEYYCLDFPSDVDLLALRKNEQKKSVSFYDLSTNKPFTTTAIFKNYPIIRISKEKSQSP